MDLSEKMEAVRERDEIACGFENMLCLDERGESLREPLGLNVKPSLVAQADRKGGICTDRGTLTQPSRSMSQDDVLSRTASEVDVGVLELD